MNGKAIPIALAGVVGFGLGVVAALIVALSIDSPSEIVPAVPTASSTSIPSQRHAISPRSSNEMWRLVDAPPESIDFSGQTWKFAGQCQSGDIFRPSMISFCYYSDSSDNVRLLVLHRIKEGLNADQVYSRIYRVQRLHLGKWISHGPAATWDVDGSRGELCYENGQLHGWQRAWYPNGQLKIERHWEHGIEHGRDSGWYESGAKMYDSNSEFGVEVSGQSWNENGPASFKDRQQYERGDGSSSQP